MLNEVMKVIKLLIKVFLFLFVFFVITFFFLKNFFGRSEIKILDTSKSPDGGYKAVYYISYGGGAAGWLYHNVQILKSYGDKLDPNDVNTVFIASHLDSVKINWEKNNVLRITYFYEDGTTIYRKRFSTYFLNDKEIKVIYDEKNKFDFK